MRGQNIKLLPRELEGVASAYSSDLAGAVPDFRLAMRRTCDGVRPSNRWRIGVASRVGWPLIATSRACKKSVLNNLCVAERCWTLGAKWRCDPIIHMTPSSTPEC